MRLGIDPTVDVVFKRLFGTEENSALVIHFLNAVLGAEGDRRIVSIEFLTPVHDRDADDDKLVIVDLRVCDQSGRHIIVEVQVVVPKAFRERILYYWAKDYVQQLASGDDYSRLVPTILVCIVVGNLFRDSPAYHHCFRLVSEDQALVFSDRLEIRTLELGKFQRPAEELADSLERWSYFFKHAESLETDQLPRSLGEPEILRAVEVLSMISQSERDRVEYEMREKRRRDMINRDQLLREGGREEGRLEGRQEGREQGRQEGRHEGREEGRDQGILIGAIRTLQRMSGASQTPVAELQEMTLEDLNALMQTLETRGPQ